jgi:hypothetical protein
MAGLIFASPMRAWIERRRRLGRLRNLEPVSVRVFPIVFPLSLDDLKRLLIGQNRSQALFQFEVADWKAWSGHAAAEARLRALQTNSRLAFVESFQAEMEDYNKTIGPRGKNLVNIAITTLLFPRNFYCWNTRDRRGIVVGIASLQTLFGRDLVAVNKIILRVVQRMLIYGANIRGLKAHEITRGCLFDLTPLLTDLQFSVDKTFLCRECERAIADDKGIGFLDSVGFWIEGRSHNPAAAP